MRKRASVVQYTYSHLLADICIPEIQVWLLLEELVQVALSSDFIIGPRRVPKDTHLRKTA